LKRTKILGKNKKLAQRCSLLILPGFVPVSQTLQVMKKGMDIKMKKSLRNQLSLSILGIVLMTIAIISVLSNYFINKEFMHYVSRQQELKTQVITTSISNQYTVFTSHWNLDYIHAIGMSSLYEGYIIKVYDNENNVLWDAQSHDMRLCNQIMSQISSRMAISYPQLNGEFKATDYPLTLDGEVIGTVSISYFGPFFLNDNDFRFLHSLNIILIAIGLVSLLVSAIVGYILAKRISRPILMTVGVTKQIAAGNYEVRLKENSNTKELSMLVESINHLASSLEILEKLRKQLTEDVAHELRTPITILQSYLEAMSDGVWEPTNERLESCYEEVVRIGRLVGDLEKLAKIESDSLKLEKTRTDLMELVEKTADSLRVEAAGRKLEIRVEGPHVEILADRDRIRQVLVNLISNAIKYSKEAGTISLTVFETEDTVGFHVQDKGIGIPREELPYIFERFYRADKSRNRSTGGSGIGLTIAKSIVEAHDGKIMVESCSGEGSKFTVILPKE
jgi:two-component system, OmpR family, sensor histidine kinase BaeS